MSMDVIKGRDETLLRVVMLNTSLLSNKPKTIDTQFGLNQCEKNCRTQNNNKIFSWPVLRAWSTHS